MLKIRSLITRALISGIVLAVGALPVTPLVFADMTAPDANGNSCFIVGSDQPGNHKPAGSDANLFTYNCATNLWESSHYTFSPITDQRTPKDQPTYTYNATTGKYDYQTWDYSASLNNYALTSHSTATPPAGANIVGGPPAPSTTITNTGSGSTNTVTNTGTPSGTQTIDGTGSGSTNTIGNDNTTNSNANDNTGVTLDTTTTGQATSGNAIVVGNTEGGTANTGNALDEATIVNMLQSSSNAVGNGTPVTFVANIDGNVDGDLLLNPASLSDIQPANNSGTNNITVNNSTNLAIDNNVNLAANSGNATVAGNTEAGDATSGSAEAIANVVNLIDSAITSGQSFIGTININGNLNGNILVPQDFVNQLVADNVPTVTISNTGANSTNSATDTGGQKTTVNNTNNLGINNNVTSGAGSGSAAVTGNTEAGNATTGNAGTSVTAFNLTGSNVVGCNDLLVFVNVVGSWVGMIINAPAGATAAELGGGCPTTSTTSGTTDVNNTTNERINNNINVAAQSGNADVKDNTEAGNATSGNAGTAVNLLNVENSSLSFSGWFGILFINVFGSWNGSFGIAPVAGSGAYPTVASNSASSNSSGGAAVPAAIRVFSFVPHATSSGSDATSSSTISNTGNGSNNFEATLAAKTAKSTKAPTPQLQSSNHANLWLPLTSLTLFAVYVAADVTYSRRHATRKNLV